MVCLRLVADDEFQTADAARDGGSTHKISGEGAPFRVDRRGSKLRANPQHQNVLTKGNTGKG